jgi:signal transduction histidine kinase
VISAAAGLDPAFDRSVGGWLSLVHPGDRAMMSRYLAEEVLGKGAFFDKEYRIIRPSDGAERWVHGRGRVSRDSQHRALTLIGTIQDITERKRAEAERAALELQIGQLNKAESLARMAGGMAHLFNNHLQAVMGNLDLLGEIPMGGEAAHFAALAREATCQASKLSRMLLAFLGQSMGPREPRSLCEFCRGSLPLIQEGLPGSVTLETECHATGTIVQAHADLIEQVLPCLVFNAQEALGAEGGCIRLRFQTCTAAAIPASHRFPIGWKPEGPDYVCLEVRDEGCGIAEEDVENLFDPFFSTKFAGRGMGLSMVLGIVQAHGGAVVVESKLGHGSTFRVYLPSLSPGPSGEALRS